MPALMTLQGPSLGAIRRPLRERLRLPAAHLYGAAGEGGGIGLGWLAAGGLALGVAVAYRMESRSKAAGVAGLRRRKYTKKSRKNWSDIAGVVRRVNRR